MSDITHEPNLDFFSHVRRALGAIALAAIGATALIGVLPLVANFADHPPQAKAADPSARKVPDAVVGR